MLRKICFALILLCLFIAIPLSLMGIHKVELGEPFLALMKAVNKDLSTYKIEIPQIPEIPGTSTFGGAWLILDVVIKFFNFMIKIINVFITLINVVIQVLQTIFLIVRHLITFKDTLANYSVPVAPIPS